ncbi:MAG: zinc ribbon domain-containing protein [Candidatus Eremiobacterota bacterium]
MTCPFCNKEIIEQAEFCPECGENINITECPSCGVELLPGKKFCHKCGTHIFQKKGPFSGFEFKGQKKTITLVLLVIIIIIILVKVMFGGRSEKHLSACELNMKSIATALAAYAIESNGIYPPSLAYCNKYLEEENLPVPPLCPACSEPYIYQKTGNIFILKCGGRNAHIKTGKVDEGHYPVYVLQHGIILKGEYISYITSEPSATPAETPVQEGLSELSICKNNLKKIATALDVYSADNNNEYPPSLEYLTKGMKSMTYIPACPACSQAYIYEKTGNDFILKCGGENAHINTGEVGEGHFPACNKNKDIIMREIVTMVTPDRTPALISSPSPPEETPVSSGELMEFINENYSALEKKDFKKAYDFKSSDWKEKNTCEDYCKYWKDNITIKLDRAEIIEESDKTAKAKIRYYAEDKNPKTGKTDKDFYSGTIELIKEDGEWRIKNVQSEKE